MIKISPRRRFELLSSAIRSVWKSGYNTLEDKRTSGWYIIQDNEGRYEVGFVAENGERSDQIWFDCRVDACALAIRN